MHKPLRDPDYQAQNALPETLSNKYPYYSGGPVSYVLMCIWLNYGYFHEGDYGVIYIDYLSFEEQQTFCKYLKDTFDINTDLKDCTYRPEDRGKIFLEQYDLFKLIRLVAPIMPIKELLPKVCFVPSAKYRGELISWAGHLERLVRPEFKLYVQDFYLDAEYIQCIKQEREEMNYFF